VELPFWKRIAPRLAVAVGEVVFTVLDGRREMVWLALLVVAAAWVEVELGGGGGVVLGAGAEVDDGAAAALEEP
jgi:hypothetical protein